MKFLNLAVAIALSISICHAGDPNWDTLGQKLIERENYDPRLGMYLITNITPPNRAETHQADYLTSDYLIADENGKAIPASVKAVSETWVKLQDGNWDIDQWIHTANRYGTLVNLSHHRILETASGTILKYEYLKTGPANSAEEIAKWLKVLNRWYLWQNNSK